MSPARKVLKDLLSGPSTDDAIASRHALATDEVSVILITARRDGLVTSSPIMITPLEHWNKPYSSGIHFWMLTEKGSQQLLNPS